MTLKRNQDRVRWHATGSLDPAVDPSTWKILPGILDGVFAYRITASDEHTWLDLHVRVRPDVCAAPQAYDIVLHTNLHQDPRGDRCQDFTSSLLGERFVGYIHALHNPHPRFWEELEKQFLEWDKQARTAYVKDMGAAAQLKKDIPGLGVAQVISSRDMDPAAGETRLTCCWRITGTTNYVALVEARDFDDAVKKYAEHCVRLCIPFGDAAQPNTCISQVERLGAITLIR